MIVRLLVKNLFSFGELTEFNMLPGRSSRLSNHILKAGSLELLKLNAIYGANGAGKSKLIQALDKVAFYHKEDKGKIKFELSQESDGTKRLFAYIPILFSLIYFDTVFFIDEYERSIHPLLIKELIKKFSLDPKAKGQLIFSTHESNLLDQDLFRPDEIWFAEKNKQGATNLFPLSDFKEHHTIYIRKGYLTGRYGAIPFLSNLKDLNWDKYAETD